MSLLAFKLSSREIVGIVLIGAFLFFAVVNVGFRHIACSFPGAAVLEPHARHAHNLERVSMKPQPGRTQPMLFIPLTMWTDLALKTGEIMLASAHAVERQAKSGNLLGGAAAVTRKAGAATRKAMTNGTHSRKTKANGKGKRSAKRRTRK